MLLSFSILTVAVSIHMLILRQANPYTKMDAYLLADTEINTPFLSSDLYFVLWISIIYQIVSVTIKSIKFFYDMLEIEEVKDAKFANEIKCLSHYCLAESGINDDNRLSE